MLFPNQLEYLQVDQITQMDLVIEDYIHLLVEELVLL